MNYNMLCVQSSVICIVFLIGLYYFNKKSEHGVRNFITRSVYGSAVVMCIADIICVFNTTYYGLRMICFALFIILWICYIVRKRRDFQGNFLKDVVIRECIYMILVPVSVLYSIIFKEMYSPVAYAVTFGLMAGIIDRQNAIIFTDNLTKLQNRYGMDEEIETQLEQYQKDHNNSFYTIVCDLDNFKTINDTWGHLEGDRALKLVAQVLTDVAVKYDSTTFRMGGDEFVIITDKSQEGLADEICNEITSRLENLNFRDDFDIKMSMGVSLYDGKQSIEQLIENADTILYDIKRMRKGE